MTQLNNSMNIQGLRDVETPIGVPLTGVYKKSFAYTTIKDRLPVILTRVIDTMSRDKEEIARKFGNEALEELKHVIGNLSRLKSELMTNKPLTLLPIGNGEVKDDIAVWNDRLKVLSKFEGSSFTWFNTAWLVCECYMYKRINRTLVLTKTLATYDPFEKQKQDAFKNSLNSITLLAKHTLGLLNRVENSSKSEHRDDLVKLLKLSLWGNRYDLSLSCGAESNSVGNPVELLDSFEDDLLVDDTRIVFDVLNMPERTNDPIIVDVVLDNSGTELFTDLCLAAFLIAHGFAGKVRFYVKRIPWYVSDVNLHDFKWTVDYMRESSDSDLKAFGDLCAGHLKNNDWTIEIESFWTEPYDFGQMKEQSSTLYEKLSEANLIVFKGDLNYRKLVGDINFEYTKSLESVLSLQDFRPTNLVAVRTLKSDVCVGLPPGKAEEVKKKNDDWLITGKYGVINALTVVKGGGGENQ